MLLMIIFIFFAYILFDRGINVRTKKIEYKLTVEKVAFGKVYFTYKMNSDYAFENADCDYSDEVCMKRIKTNMINSNLYSKNISIRNYGYVVAQNIEIDVYNEALSIRDLKDTHLIYYKISYKEFSFDEISEDEYNNIAKQNR